jgi:signal transduction histidine kinase
MKKMFEKLVRLGRTLIERYPVVLAGIVIYLYYLLTSVEFFKHRSTPHSFLEYIMQFDSVFFMWVAAAAWIQVQRTRNRHKEESDKLKQVQRILDKQQIYGQLVNDITTLLQDSVNNPLAVIKLTTQEIRRRFEKDTEILRWLDRIDGAMQRIHNTIRDLQAYETQKMIESSTNDLNEKLKKS